MLSPDVAVVLAAVTAVVGGVVATVPAMGRGNAEHNVVFQYLKTANCNNSVPSPPLAYAHTHTRTHTHTERERERGRERGREREREAESERERDIERERGRGIEGGKGG